MLRKTSAELERTVKASSKAEDALKKRVAELEQQIMTIMTQTLMGDDDELGVVTVEEVRETQMDPTYNTPSASVQRMAASFKASHLKQIEKIGYTFAENGVPFVALAPLRHAQAEAESHHEAWFIVEENFIGATKQMFQARQAVYEELRRSTTWVGAENSVERAAAMCSFEGEHAVAIDMLRYLPENKNVCGDSALLQGVAQWMLEQKLALSWTATFYALLTASKGLLTDPVEMLKASGLPQRTHASPGAKVLALDITWRKAVVESVDDEENSVDLVIDDATIESGSKRLPGIPRAHAVVCEEGGGVGELLLTAVQDNKEELVQMLLEAGTSPLVADDTATTPLHVAATMGYLEVCRRLVAAGADPHVSNALGKDAEKLARLNRHFSTARVFRPTLSDEEFTPQLCMSTARLAAAMEGDIATLQLTQDEGRRTALMVASRAKQQGAVSVLIDSGSDVNAQSKWGFTALYLAAEEGDDEIVRLLLSSGADIGLLAVDGGSCLHRSCFFGHERCVEALLAEGAALVDHAGNDGQTSLMLSCVNGFDGIVRSLIDAGATVDLATSKGFTSLMKACDNGHEACVRELVEGGADVNLARSNGSTSLMACSVHGHIECVKVLIAERAQVDVARSDGWTSLMACCVNGHDECAQALLDAGAQVDLPRSDGGTSLMLSCQNGYEKCARNAIDAGANIDLARSDGWTSLMLSCQGGHVACAKELIKAGAAINTSRSNGWTSLMLSCHSGHEACARALIEADAAIDQAMHDGFTALMAASHNGQDECVQLLLEAGASINLARKNGFTSLMLAARNGHLQTARLLIEKGAAADFESKGETTALVLAQKNGHEAVVKLLAPFSHPDSSR